MPTGTKILYEYDILGRKITRQIEKAKTEYSYSSGNKVTKIVDSLGNMQENSYDPMGHWTSVVRNGVTSNYIFRGTEVSHELNEDNNVKNREVRGYKLLNKETSNLSLQSKVYYYLHNEHSDVTSLVDEENKIKNSYEYDVFGDLTKSEEEANNEFKYYEQQWDKETHLLYLRARYYKPTMGRFTQEDVYIGDGLNLYVYVKNNPVMWVDPSWYLTQRELVAIVANMSDEEVRNALNIRYDEYKQVVLLIFTVEIIRMDYQCL